MSLKGKFKKVKKFAKKNAKQIAIGAGVGLATGGVGLGAYAAIKNRKKLGSFAKKTAKKVGKTVVNVTAAAVFAPLLPFKALITAELKKKGVKTAGMSFPNMARKFYNLVVAKHQNLDEIPEHESLDGDIIADNLNDDAITIVNNTIGFLKGLKKKSVNGAQLSTSEKNLVAQTKKVETALANKAGKNAKILSSKMSTGKKSRNIPLTSVKKHKKLGRFLKKTAKKVGKTAKKVGKTVVNVTAAAAFAPLLPFKALIIAELKKKGVKTAGMSFPNMARKFYNLVVAKHQNLDEIPEHESLDGDIIADNLVSDVVSIVKDTIGFLKGLKKKKSNGEPLSTTEKNLVAQTEKVEAALVKKAGKDANFLSTEMSADEKSRNKNLLVMVGVALAVFFFIKK